MKSWVVGVAALGGTVRVEQQQADRDGAEDGVALRCWELTAASATPRRSMKVCRSVRSRSCCSTKRTGVPLGARMRATETSPTSVLPSART